MSNNYKCMESIFNRLYRDMSGGKFWLIGDVYEDLIVLDNQDIYYSSSFGRNISYATKEVLDKIDGHVNWELYDKFDPCDYNSNSNEREPDGTVDFIFMVFRFINSEVTDGGRYTGIASLSGNNNQFSHSIDNYETKDGFNIAAGFPGSGCLAEIQNRWDFGILSHELTEHYTYGLGHSNTMGTYNLCGGNIASAYDRNVLGWNFGTEHTPTSNATITLRDYITQGDFH